jgi:hypothetical protein
MFRGSPLVPQVDESVLNQWMINHVDGHGPTIYTIDDGGECELAECASAGCGA